MLRLPLEGEETPPLVVKEALRHRHSRPGHSRDKRAERIFDETFAGKSDPAPIYGRILVASLATIGAIVLIGLLWPRGGEAEDASSPPVTRNQEPVPPPVAGSDDEPLVLTVGEIRDELEPVVRAFLEAPDLESASRLTARPGRTLERMRQHHGDDYRPPGLRLILWNEALTRGEKWASFRIETGEFRRGRIFLVQDGGWKIDWESWAGWSPMSWDQLKTRRPREPVRIRAVVRAIDYYNFEFSDESEWAAFVLVPPDDSDSLYGYVPRFGSVRSRTPVMGEKEERLLLDIRFPADSNAANQVLIDDVVGEGWLDTTDLP